MTKDHARLSCPELGLATAAHDLNNIVATITAAAEAALARSSVDSNTRADLLRIRTSAQRGGAMLRQLLSYRGTVTLSTPCLSPASVDQVIEEFAATLRHVAGPEVRFAFHPEASGQLALLDPDDLQDALLNLVVNARDALRGGGTLDLCSYTADFSAPFDAIPQPVPPGHYIVIELLDNGCGVPLELQRHVFTPFFTTKPGDCGSGLGLYAVQETLRRHGGAVTLDSTSGRGTRIRLYLPRLIRPLRAEGRGCALLAEDEPSLRHAAARALADKGWRLVVAEDGEALLRALPRGAAGDERPALLISDIALPGIDGPTLLEAVRREWPGLPAILVSGYPQLNPRSVPDPVAFLRKPFAVAELIHLAAAVAQSALAESAEFMHCSSQNRGYGT
jgi:two-component system cell cycle sensor histidine kinase/response regulator CckA